MFRSHLPHLFIQCSLSEGEKKYTLRIARATIPSHALMYDNNKSTNLMRIKNRGKGGVKQEVLSVDDGVDVIDLVDAKSSNEGDLTTISSSSDDGLSLIGLYIIHTRIDEVLKRLKETQTNSAS